MRTLRRASAKFILVVLATVAAIFITDSLIFFIAGSIKWELRGPWPVGEPIWVAEWQHRFGRLTQNSTVLAPLVPPRNSADTWYRVEEAAPAEPIHSPSGMIQYKFGRGPQVPVLPPLPDLLKVRDHQPGVLPRFVHGWAHISSDGDIWCRTTIPMPFYYRTREYVGTVDDFPPSPWAKGWRTWYFNPVMFAQNVAVWLLLFGWLFFLREFRLLFATVFFRRRLRRRQGRCEACGYDLRRLNGQRCPECGWRRDSVQTFPS